MIAASSFSGSGLACIRGGRLLFAGLGFDLNPGGCLLLTGPNGIGKSSLLRLMAGLLPAAAGRVRTDTTLFYLGHADTLKAQLTVGETLAFWARLAGRDAAAVNAAMAAYALEPLAAMPCRYLSAGQRRRVALARAIADGGRLWLLDEPLTALDSASIQAFERALAAHRADGGAAVIATHGAIDAPGAATLEIAHFAGSDLSDPFYRGLTLDREA